MAMSTVQAASAAAAPSFDLFGCFRQRVQQLILEPVPDDLVQARAKACCKVLRQLFFQDPTRQAFVRAFMPEGNGIIAHDMAKLLVAVLRSPKYRIAFASYGTAGEGPDAELVCSRVLLLAGIAMSLKLSHGGEECRSFVKILAEARVDATAEDMDGLILFQSLVAVSEYPARLTILGAVGSFYSAIHFRCWEGSNPGVGCVGALRLAQEACTERQRISDGIRNGIGIERNASQMGGVRNRLKDAVQTTGLSSAMMDLLNHT